MAEAPAAAVPSKVRRELGILLAGIAFGLVVFPLLVYLAGAATLGPYDGGLGAFLAVLYGDFARLGPAAWLLLLGPYVLFQAVRVLTRPLRRSVAAGRPRRSSPPRR
jgi:hypothetical protein